MTELEPGTIVRMSRRYRKYLRWQGSRKPRWLHNGARQHVREFGRCIGMVIGLTDYNNCKPGEPGYNPEIVGPEVDVRWQPSNLRYMYDTRDLEVVR